MIELASIVGVRNGAGLLKDSLGSRNQVARPLEIAVVQRQDAGIEDRIRAQVGVIGGEDPLARAAKSVLGFSPVAAVQGDIEEVVVFARHAREVSQSLAQRSTLEVEGASLVEPTFHSGRRRSQV